LAYIGVSWGGDIGGLMVPVENRFKTAIFVCGGICSQYHPTDDQANFAPHITIPILMIGGKYDTIHPYDVSQKPLFDLIGTSEPLKKMVLFPCGHGIPRKYQKEYQRIFFEWLDKYLEPVKLIDENQGINKN
jgi:pimeloyl-ACP methyl ester carboxylesterase